MDYDNLTPGPDLDNLDLTKLDRGNSVEPPRAQQAEPEESELQEEQEETEETEEKEEVKEKPRDEKGKFTGKGRIPVDRHKAVLEKEREARDAAERRAADLERQLAERNQNQQQNQQIDDMEAQIAAMKKVSRTALLDGDEDKADEIDRHIRVMERQIARAEAEGIASQRTAIALESERMELAIAQLEAAHPVLNPASEQFDETLVNFVLAEQQRLMKQDGLSASRAITRAATTVVERYGVRAETKDDPKGLNKAAEDRKAQQVAKNLDTQRRQPASTRDVGMDSDKIGEKALPAVGQMTSEEYAALPASTRAKLRGDML